MSKATLNLGGDCYAFASPHSLALRKREGLPDRAEIGVVLPSGKSERVVRVELTEEECLLLAERALSAARALRAWYREGNK